MALKLKLVRSQEQSTVGAYVIFSIALLIVGLYLFFVNRNAYPSFLKNMPALTINVIIGLIFLNGIYALLSGFLKKPNPIGILSVDEAAQKIIVDLEESGKHDIKFSDINRVDFDITGYKSITENVHGAKNFVEIFYNLSIQRERYEFIIESPSDMHIMKNAFASIRSVSPRVMINY